MANNEFPKSITNTPAEDHSFDWKLFLTVAWITRWWIVIYFIAVLLFAYLYIRYATPVYESQADVQFKDRSKDNSIDLGILVSSPNADRLNEEMTVLESKGYKLQALKTLPINISYFLSERVKSAEIYNCLLYTSDAADERSSVDLGGRRIIKKKNKHKEEKKNTHKNNNIIV